MRDLIFEEVFDEHSDLTGAEKLQPLLVCRQVYHEAKDVAWASTIFDAMVFAINKLEMLETQMASNLHACTKLWAFESAHVLYIMVHLVDASAMRL